MKLCLLYSLRAPALAISMLLGGVMASIGIGCTQTAARSALDVVRQECAAVNSGAIVLPGTTSEEIATIVCVEEGLLAPFVANLLAARSSAALARLESKKSAPPSPSGKAAPTYAASTSSNIPAPPSSK